MPAAVVGAALFACLVVVVMVMVMVWLLLAQEVAEWLNSNSG
jgi:hypothetical protein